jgi:DNA replicative helicase MCM subunit Mcm2 (Cdc46/Mcm family)
MIAFLVRTVQVKVYGIVTKASLVRPKVVRAVQYCPATKKTQTTEFRDGTAFAGGATGSAYPLRDQEGNLLVTEFGLSTYRDHQVVVLQACRPCRMPQRVAEICMQQQADDFLPAPAHV